MVRIVRIAVSFAAVVAAYAAYSNFVVPAIEPPVEVVSDAGTPPGEFSESDVSARVRELAPLFRPDSWQVKNPKILDNNQSKLLFQDYINRSNGEVELHPCTIVYDPGGPSADAAARIRRCVVIDAPGGAIAIRQAAAIGPGRRGPPDRRANVGYREHPQRRPIARAGRRSAGSHQKRAAQRAGDLDDPRVVDFRFGGSYGRGREMHIRLAPGDDSRPSDSPGPNVGGLESVRAEARDRSAAPRSQPGEDDTTTGGGFRVRHCQAPSSPTRRWRFPAMGRCNSTWPGRKPRSATG